MTAPRPDSSAAAEALDFRIHYGDGHRLDVTAPSPAAARDIARPGMADHGPITRIKRKLGHDA